MAILPGVPYVRVCINSTNGNLKEHPDPDGPLPREPGQPRQNKMSIYVESKSSAAFRFEYFVMQKRIPKNTCLAFYAIIDGHRTSSMTICNEDGFKPKQWTHVLKGDRIRKPDGTMNMRGFEFAEINTVDSDVPPIAQNDISKLGELVVQIWRVRRGAMIPPPTEQPTAPKDDTRYHEKELKGRDVSHATKFGPEKKAKETETFFQLEYIDPVETPLVEFHFKYRSREVLQQMMIIPRDPSPRRQPIPRPLPSPIIDVQLRQAGKENAASPSTTRNPPKADKLAAIIAISRAASSTRPAKSNPNKIPIQPRLPPKPLFDFLPAQPQIPAAPTASPAIFKAVSNAHPKGAPATPVETRTDATYRPDAMTPASTGLKAASESSATPFSRVMNEINKNIGHLRNMTKGTAAGSEARTVISEGEEKIRKETNPQAKLKENGSIKRERAQDSDDDLQVVLERPVKRRHVFTDDDHIIDLTGP